MKKQIMKRIFAAALTAASLMTAFSPAAAAVIESNEAAARIEQQMIEDIITTYGTQGAQADEAVQTLLHELHSADSRQGALWTDIMEYWHYVDTDLTVNIDILPENLPEDNSMALTVLGYQLNADGTMQDELIACLETALACAEQYPNAYVICSGGGTAKNNPDVTEAGQMGEWMLAHGLDADRLIIENQAKNTAENAANSYNILRQDYPQVDSVVMISSSYHVARGSLLFEAAFLQSASEQQSPEIHVISNCACAIENSAYQPENALRMEAGSMLQMIGSNQLAMEFLFGGRKPMI